MPAIKRTQADIWFSKCIRARSNYTCERCGAKHAENSSGLHCSHFHGRGKWSVRFDPENCEALCYGCHSYMEQHPQLYSDRILEKLGPIRFEALQERANDTKRGRQAKKEKKELSKHFREQFDLINQVRQNQNLDYIEFEGYL